MMHKMLRFVRKGSGMEPQGMGERLLYSQLLAALPEGQTVDLWVSPCDADHSLAQLSRLHAMIRELALTEGNTMSSIKRDVKKAIGLCLTIPDPAEPGKFLEYLRSFGSASRDELALAIEEVRRRGEFVGCQFT